MDEAALTQIAWRGIVAFQRVVGRHAPEAALLEGEGFVASRVPGVEASLPNAAVPVEGARLEPRLTELQRFYAEIPKWGVWIDPDATEDVEALTGHGLVLDSTPVLMATPLDRVTAAEHTRVVTPSPETVGAVNDAAYGTAHPHLTRTTSTFPPDALHSYALQQDDEIACVLMILDVGDDAFVTLVATLPHHRGKRLASALLAHALHEAKQRRRTTTSLQASKQGHGLYARLGYRPLTEAHLYEKRPG